MKAERGREGEGERSWASILERPRSLSHALKNRASPATRERRRVRVSTMGTEGGGLLGVIADEETVTGFLLAGVGDAGGSVGGRNRKNFLTVTSSTWTSAARAVREGRSMEKRAFV